MRTTFTPLRWPTEASSTDMSAAPIAGGRMTRPADFALRLGSIALHLPLRDGQGVAHLPSSQPAIDDLDAQRRSRQPETGGGFFELEKTADLNSTFTRVIQELHSQYAMAFTPERLDGKVHKLTVRVKKPGMKTRARQTYVAK